LRKIGKHARGHFVAYLALFFALGGTSFAAVTALPRNSVGSPQIKNGAIQKIDISKRTVSALRGLRGPRGLQGIQGIQGIQGVKGDKGDKGADFTVTSTLQAGQTETGVYAAWGQGSAAGGYLADGVNFRVPLPADLPTNHDVFVPQGTTSATHCPGKGQAESGYLCIYEVAQGNSTEVNAFDPTTGGNAISALGFNIYFTFDAAGAAWSYGEWAVTP
jgi:hypothetical protein